MADAAYHRRWRAANREKVLAQHRQYYLLHLEQERERAAASMWRSYRTNPAHREKRNMDARTRSLWVLYRLTPEEYQVILDHQKGKCAGCGRPPGPIRLAVDHCHKTGRVRGLLCWLCNRAIGILRDNAKAATNLGAYLADPPAPLALGKETYGLIGKAKASKKLKVYGPPAVAVISKSISKRKKKT